MSWNSNLVGRAIYYQLRSLCGGRVYPGVIAQDAAFPCIAYSITSSTPDHTKDSKSVADKLRITIDIFSKSFDNANVTASLVRDQLDFVVGTIEGIPLDSIRYDGEQSLYENDVRIHHIAQDYIVRIPNDSAPVNTQSTTVLIASEDTIASSMVPPGYTLSHLIFDNATDSDAQISAGTNTNLIDIISSETILANSLTTIILGRTFSMTDFQSIYFNHAGPGDTWGSATLTIYAVIIKVK